MTKKIPHILLVNPWIHDFAAYDFWAKPLGLLTLASILRLHGFSVSYIDCLDRFHPKSMEEASVKRQGRGPYLKTQIPRPKGLEDIPRTFSRYGILPEWFINDLLSIPEPELVFVTSLMTYWYPGVKETIVRIKEVFQDIPVVLGGIYATLCHDHAVSQSGADKIVIGAGEKKILTIAEEITGFSSALLFKPEDLDTYPYPAFDLQRKISYIPLLTTKGCPFSCAYCASHFLNPEISRRSPDSIVNEICYWHETFGIMDFAFYDDALLIDPGNHAVPLLEGIINKSVNVRFHTPNALHIREISKKTASLMFNAGFKTLRLGLETVSFDKRSDLDKKVKAEEFQQAVSYLKEAGFNKNQVGAYLLVGLPGQSITDIELAVKTVQKSGITPVPAYYTPIPHTALWNRAVKSSRYDLESDPIFANNAILPCWREAFSWKDISYIKKIVRGE